MKNYWHWREWNLQAWVLVISQVHFDLALSHGRKNIDSSSDGLPSVVSPNVGLPTGGLGRGNMHWLG